MQAEGSSPAAAQTAAGLFLFVSYIRSRLSSPLEWGPCAKALPAFGPFDEEQEGAERSDVAQGSLSCLQKERFDIDLLKKHN